MTLEKRTGADFRRMPWKNGGGVTHQLAIWPPGADLTDFDWRLSSAEVACSGPFSRFDGIDRSLAVLAGGSLQLTLDTTTGPSRLTLAPGMQLDGFAGELPIDCQLTAGQTVIDFNIMTRRDRYQHHLRRLHGHTAQQVDGTPWLCYLTAGVLQAGSLRVHAGELLLGNGPQLLQGQAEGWLVQIQPLAQSQG